MFTKLFGKLFLSANPPAGVKTLSDAELSAGQQEVFDELAEYVKPCGRFIGASGGKLHVVFGSNESTARYEFTCPAFVVVVTVTRTAAALLPVAVNVALDILHMVVALEGFRYYGGDVFADHYTKALADRVRKQLRTDGITVQIQPVNQQGVAT